MKKIKFLRPLSTFLPLSVIAISASCKEEDKKPEPIKPIEKPTEKPVEDLNKLNEEINKAIESLSVEYPQVSETTIEDFDINKIEYKDLDPTKY